MYVGACRIRICHDVKRALRRLFNCLLGLCVSLYVCAYLRYYLEFLSTVCVVYDHACVCIFRVGARNHWCWSQSARSAEGYEGYEAQEAQEAQEVEAPLPPPPIVWRHQLEYVSIDACAAQVTRSKKCEMHTAQRR